MDSCKDEDESEAGRRRDEKPCMMIDCASSSYAIAPVLRSVAALLHRAILTCAHCLEGQSLVSLLDLVRNHPVVNAVNVVNC